MLTAAVASCGDDGSCISDYLIKKYSFNEKGALETKLTLKTIHDGKFTKLN